MNARDAAYAEAKRRIIDGEWGPGTLLSEAVVGAELSMSRTPVHAAFVQLAAEGLIELRSRKGAVVAPIRRDEALDLLDVRAALEVAAVRRVMGSREQSEELESALRQALDAQLSSVGRGDAESFAEADDEFHSAIVSASGNRIAADISRQLGDRQHRLRRFALGQKSVERMGLVEEHRLLLDAVEARDIDAFDVVLRAHLSHQLGVL